MKIKELSKKYKLWKEKKWKTFGVESCFSKYPEVNVILLEAFRNATTFEKFLEEI